VPSSHGEARLDLRSLALFLALALLWAFFTLGSGFAFLDPGNLRNLSIELSCTAILALGMLLIMVVGHIDLAVGSGVGLTAAIVAVLISGAELPWSRLEDPSRYPQLDAAVAMLISLGAIVALWTAMGWVIARERIPAFIITLAGLLVFKGAFWLVINSRTISVRAGGDNVLSVLTSASLPHVAGWVLAGVIVAMLGYGVWRSRRSRAALGLPVGDGETSFLGLLCTAQFLALVLLNLNVSSPQMRGVPIALLLLGAAAAATWVLTQHTRLGRHLYACGSNEAAAALSGVPIRRVTVSAFALCGLAVAVTGWMQAAYIGNATTTVGDLMELDAIAACVIGGVSVKGGRGTVIGVLSGALLITTLINGLTVMGVSPELKFIARGSILALAVWMDVRLNQRR
jgi:D-xylose transport system permease protein